jgi:hypothetical protein
MSVHQTTPEGRATGGDVRRGTVASVSCNDAYSFSKPVRDEIMLVAGIGVDGDVHAGVHVKHRSRVRADSSQPNLRQVHLIRAELFDEVRDQGFEVAAGQLGENVTTLGLDLLGLPRGTVLRFGPPKPTGARDRPDSGRPDSGRPDSGRPDSGRVEADRSIDRPGPASDAVAAVVAAAETARLDAPTAEAVSALVAATGRVGPDDARPTVVITGMRNPCGQIDNFQDGLLKQVAYRDGDGTFVRRAGIMGVVLRGGPIRPGDPVTAELPPQPHQPLDRV